MIGRSGKTTGMPFLDIQIIRVLANTVGGDLEHEVVDPLQHHTVIIRPRRQRIGPSEGNEGAHRAQRRVPVALTNEGVDRRLIVG